MTPQVHAYAPDAEYFFREGCHINELANSAEDPDVSIARARVEPGATTRWHALADIDERYVILEGQGRVELGDRLQQAVAPGDVVVIPARTAQRISNTGDADLVFLAVCTPRFRPEAYRDLEA